MRWVGLPCVPLTRTNHQTYTHTHLVLCLSVTKLTPHSPTCSRLDLSDLLHECIRRWTKKIKIFECDKMIIPINVSRE
jgi:Ulp1 family protease